MSNVPHAFATAVRAARNKKRLTQLKLAEMVGMSLDAISALERGVNVPTIETAAKLIKVLEIDPAAVFGSSSPPESTLGERKAAEAELLRVLAGTDDKGLALLLQLAVAVAATHPSPHSHL